MTEVIRHSRVRDVNGPRAVDSNRTSSRRHRPSKPESSHQHRRKRAHHPAEPSFELNIIGQPAQHIALGTSIETSIVISLRTASGDRPPRASSIDTSPFLGVATLVLELSNGEKVQLENGCMTGQKMFDSVHGIPEQCLDSNRAVLGYFTFPGLLIRQVGTFRVRVALMKMTGAGTGAVTLATVDSELIRVERRLRYQ